MPSFDLVVVGCGGGPNECNLSSYLLKPCARPWNSGIIAVEAGSGLGALVRILLASPDLFGTEDASENLEVVAHTSNTRAADIMSWIRSYLITHAHMDHINSLVLSAGSIGGPTRRIFAVHETLENIETVFSDRLWPQLASWNERDKHAALIYSELHVNGSYEPISDDVSVRTMPLSHGQCRTGTTYNSAAFFIRHNLSLQEFLFCGDVEPDSVAVEPRLRDVWRAAAPKIPHMLSTLFVECSYPVGRPDDFLYGHLNPEHLAVELAALGEEVVRARILLAEEDNDPQISQAGARKKQKKNPISAKELRGALQGLRIYIIHCKEDLQHNYDRPINHVIADQVRKLVEAQALGADIIAASQGMHISM